MNGWAVALIALSATAVICVALRKLLFRRREQEPLKPIIDDKGAGQAPPAYRPIRSIIPIPRFIGEGDPPPFHWKACHPSTIKRFKAEMCCPEGHGLVLKGHSIAADGRVSPSIVCPNPTCSFHEFVSLSDWEFGAVQ